MLDLASHILDTKAGHFNPSRFKDEFEMELRKLVKRKAAGKPIEYAAPAAKPGNVVDLMDALRQSLQARGRSAGPARARRKKKTRAGTPRRKTSGRRRRAA
jgi:non-homologous end joining protein Ku